MRGELMKIGAFAKKNEISIDTVRHYINMGLVLPIKEDGSQYHFDHRCQEQVEEILNLKAMGFQLKEIKNIFMYKLLSNMTGYQKDAYYRMLFEDKYKLITQEIDQLGLAKDKLVSELKVLESHKDDKHHTIGLPLSAIDMLACPACQSMLRI
jgi:DNA-binding transcriptional MerR regulator